MGTYETFIVKCPTCNQEISLQTKLFESEMNTIRIGNSRNNPVTGLLDDYVIISKDCCYKCNNIPVFVFHNGKFIEIIAVDKYKEAMDGYYTVILEGSFGAYSCGVILGEKEYTSRW